MDLWIRSQDKLKLVKVNYVYIMESNNHFTMYGETIDSGPIIGTYKTKERALEVLDEIQRYLRYNKNADINNSDFLKFLNTQCNQEKCNTILNNIAVYEMPKE